MYTVTENSGSFYVRDDGLYVGCVHRHADKYRASMQFGAIMADFGCSNDAIEWIVAEHRGISWADRTEATRRHPEYIAT